MSLPNTPLLVMGRPWDSYADAIQASRFIPVIPREFGDLTLVVDPALQRLFSAFGLPVVSLGCGSVSEANRHVEPRTDVYQFSTRLIDGALTTFLWAEPGWGHRVVWTDTPQDPGPAALWTDEHIRLSKSRPQVGLCWNAAACAINCSNTAGDIPPDALAPLLRTGGFGLIALQLAAPLHRLVDHGPAIRNVPEYRRRPVTMLADLGVRDWADTAGILQQLDLVITVDTGVAHLAGALGVPTWLLLHTAADARWGSGDRSLLYPSIRIFRQSARGDWAGVINEVRTALPQDGEY